MKTFHAAPILAAAFGLLAIGSIESRADGIPIDRTRTKITTEHKLVTMTPDQVEEAIAFRTVTLTADQWAGIRAEFPGCPKRFEIVTHQFNDCSCGLPSAYGIWLPNRQLGIPTRGLKKVSTSVRLKLKSTGTCIINVDHRGQFYKDGELIPFPALKTQIKEGIAAWTATRPASGLHLSVGVPAEMNEKSVALAGRMTELRKMLEDAGGSMSGW